MEKFEIYSEENQRLIMILTAIMYQHPDNQLSLEKAIMSAERIFTTIKGIAEVMNK